MSAPNRARCQRLLCAKSLRDGGATLWQASGLKTGDELVAVGPMVMSAYPEAMLAGYRQLMRGPLQGVVVRTRRRGRELPKLTIDVVGP